MLFERENDLQSHNGGVLIIFECFETILIISWKYIINFGVLDNFGERVLTTCVWYDQIHFGGL